MPVPNGAQSPPSTRAFRRALSRAEKVAGHCVRVTMRGAASASRLGGVRRRKPSKQTSSSSPGVGADDWWCLRVRGDDRGATRRSGASAEDACQGAGCRGGRGGLRPRGRGRAGRQGGRSSRVGRDAAAAGVVGPAGGGPRQRRGLAGAGRRTLRCARVWGCSSCRSWSRRSSRRTTSRRPRRWRRFRRIVETPQGLAAAAHVAEHERVIALILGYADLAAALGRRGAEDDVSRWLVAQESVLVRGPDRRGGRRRRAVVRAARCAAPWRTSARAARELGFDGKWAIHPAQIAPIQAEFAASAGERRWAAAREGGRRGRRRWRGCGGGAGWRDGRRGDGPPRRPAARTACGPRAAGGRPGDAQRRRAVLRRLRARRDVHRAGCHADRGPRCPASGDRRRPPAPRARRRPVPAVSGTPGLLAHPMLVCDIAIGQSTAPSMRVLGNLFYRGLGARPVPVGTTLHTTTEVVARRAASRGRGIVALRVRTLDGQGEPVLDFHRAPLLPASERGVTDEAATTISTASAPRWSTSRDSSPPGGISTPLRAEPLGSLFAELRGGGRGRRRGGGDRDRRDRAGAPVAQHGAHAHRRRRERARPAPGLRRARHRRRRVACHARRCRTWRRSWRGSRATTSARRSRESACIRAWRSPRCEPLADGGLVHLRVTTTSTGDDERARDVLDWRLVALMP